MPGKRPKSDFDAFNRALGGAASKAEMDAIRRDLANRSSTFAGALEDYEAANGPIDAAGEDDPGTESEGESAVARILSASLDKATSLFRVAIHAVMRAIDAVHAFLGPERSWIGWVLSKLLDAALYPFILIIKVCVFFVDSMGSVFSTRGAGYYSSGWTLRLPDLLVLICMIAIGIALFLPSVQSARAAARQAECANHLRQMGMAVEAFVSTRNQLPPGMGPAPLAAPNFGEGPRVGVHALILPFLEDASLYASFNLDVEIDSTPQNETARCQQVSIYLCPSDGGGYRSPGTRSYPGSKGYWGQSNYYGNNGGTAAQIYGKPSDVFPYSETYSGAPGIFNVSLDTSAPRPEEGKPSPDYRKVTSRVTIASITDGTSNTTLFSEVRISSIPWPNPESTPGDPNNVYLLKTWSSTYDNNIPPSACSGGPFHDRFTYKGQQYYRGNIPELAYYNHTMTPNTRQMDCGDSTHMTSAHMAARSYHAGGVNTLFCDGSVKFIKDSLSLPTWKALGTRAGGEVISPDAY